MPDPYNPDPYYENWPIPQFTPAEYFSPHNIELGGDPSLYYGLSPGGRFPGDSWMHREFMAWLAGIEQQIVDEGNRMAGDVYTGDGSRPNEGPGILRQLYEIGRAALMGGNVSLMSELLERYGTLTTPTDPSLNTPFLYSAPGAQFGPPGGGTLDGLLDRFRDTSPPFGHFGGLGDAFPGLPGPPGSESRGPHPDVPSTLPAWQGQTFNPQFLDWQPHRPLSEPARFVSAYGEGGGVAAPATAPPASPPSPAPLAAPGPAPGLPPGPPPSAGPPPSPVPAAPPADLSGLLAALFPDASPDAMDRLTEMDPEILGRLIAIMAMRGQGPIPRDFGDTSNLSPADIDFGPDWGTEFVVTGGVGGPRRFGDLPSLFDEYGDPFLSY